MVIYQTNTLKDLFCSSIEIKKWESGFLHPLSENWPSAACSRDRSELWILHLHWSQTFEESFSSQGCLQLTSSEDHFPSCLCGLTIVSMFSPPPLCYSLFFRLKYPAISFVHTFLCILSCRIFSWKVCVIEGFHVSEYPETVSCLWSLIQILIFCFWLFLCLGRTMQNGGS